jgi:hypothetical protein
MGGIVVRTLQMAQKVSHLYISQTIVSLFSMSLNILPLVFNGRHVSLGGGRIDHEHTYGIVVFLDALGVKRIWETKDPQQVLDD